jgi:hypothetical protein
VQNATVRLVLRTVTRLLETCHEGLRSQAQRIPISSNELPNTMKQVLLENLTIAQRVKGTPVPLWNSKRAPLNRSVWETWCGGVKA